MILGFENLQMIELGNMSFNHAEQVKDCLHYRIAQFAHTEVWLRYTLLRKGTGVIGIASTRYLVDGHNVAVPMRVSPAVQ